MCGIIGYTGTRQTAGKLVVAGLQHLEYRGYDSFGFAELAAGRAQIFKMVGKVTDFKTAKHAFARTSTAIGHTRWATHGGVTQTNAHPIASKSGRIVVVHNGIVENYQQLRKELIKKGFKFVTQTDTEVIPHCIESLLGRLSFREAALAAARSFHGRFAFLAADAETGELVAIRNGSPLILGLESGPEAGNKLRAEVMAAGIFVGSDIQAFLSETRDVIYLDDGECALISSAGRAGKQRAEFVRLDSGESIEKRIIRIDAAEKEAGLGKYQHFMLKEIMEQKDSLLRALVQDQKDLNRVADAIHKSYGTFFVGCGTAGKVCLAAEAFFARIAQRHINVVVGSEFDLAEPFLKSKSLVVAVSQSGETIDILDAFAVASRKKAKKVAVVNVTSSTVARQADIVLPVNAGPEKAVASTKATTSQLAILMLLAYTHAGRLDEGKRVLLRTASLLDELLNPRYSARIAKLAKEIKSQENLYIIGKAENYAMSLEAAIKIQEVSYIHAQGFAAGELKHGPLALIAKGTPVIIFVPTDGPARAAVLSNAAEVKARGGRIIGVSPVENEIFDDWIRVPDAGDAQSIVNIVPVQLLAYHLGVLRGNNPDRPRNLAKSVTVK